ncbi:MAG: DUF2807 domain-containing protein [Hymenobacteraceae bacterium]|nr:DUF2807 domain-containing protein [Hymenobacteraceae bacterium]
MKNTLLRCTSLTAALLVGIVLTFSSCDKDYGPRITETRNTGPFAGIILKGSSEVEIRYDSITEVVVETPEEVMNHVENTVSGQNLYIQINKNFSGGHNTKIRIKTPALNLVKLDGSGNMTVHDAFGTSTMVSEIDGSGNVRMPMSANKLTATISGSGNMTLYGDVDEQSLLVDGSGNIDAFNLISETTNATISGSGNINVFASKFLNATISGSGNIRYKGSPQVSQNISGSGNVSKSN